MCVQKDTCLHAHTHDVDGWVDDWLVVKLFGWMDEWLAGWMDSWRERDFTDQVLNHLPYLHIPLSLPLSLSILFYPFLSPSLCPEFWVGRRVQTRNLFFASALTDSSGFWVWSHDPVSWTTILWPLTLCVHLGLPRCLCYFIPYLVDQRPQVSGQYLSHWKAYSPLDSKDKEGSKIEDTFETSVMARLLLLEMAFSSLLSGSKHSSENICFGVYRKLAVCKKFKRLLEGRAKRQLLSKWASLFPVSLESPGGGDLGASLALPPDLSLLCLSQLLSLISLFFPLRLFPFFFLSLSHITFSSARWYNVM